MKQMVHFYEGYSFTLTPEQAAGIADALAEVEKGNAAGRPGVLIAQVWQTETDGVCAKVAFIPHERATMIQKVLRAEYVGAIEIEAKP